jgi:thiamine pyridinylase
MQATKTKQNLGGLRTLLPILGFIGILILNLSCRAKTPEVPASHLSAEQPNLKVALYRYVPDFGFFSKTVRKFWSAIPDAPQIEIVTNWVCYESDSDPSNLDVFVFDAIFLSSYAQKNYLRPYASSEILEGADYFSYASNGCVFNGAVYGLPEIGCTDVLYYRPGDTEMAAVTDLSSLWKTLGPAKYASARPPNNVGLMVDFSDDTTCACEYLTTQESLYNVYTNDPQLVSSSNLDRLVMADLCEMVQMAGTMQAGHSGGPDYERAIWFDTGAGRAVVGFPESMSAMTNHGDSVRFKVMPHSDGAVSNLFYVDAIGINKSTVGTSREKWAVRMAELLASPEFTEAVFAGKDRPQYLLPVRQSVFAHLANRYPQYKKMYSTVQNANPQAFRIGPTCQQWLDASKRAIKNQIQNMTGCRQGP